MHGSSEYHLGWVRSIVFSPDGQLVASANSDETIKLWDVRTGNLQSTLGDHLGWNRLAFSPDGQFLASVSQDTVRTWNVITGKLLGVWGPHRDAIKEFLFSPDNKFLAFAPYLLGYSWDATGSVFFTAFENSSERITGLAFSADGQTLASASMDMKIRLWDVTTRQTVGILEGHSHSREIEILAFSHDGRLIVSGSRDGTVVLWDVKTKQVMGVFWGHSTSVTALCFSPDARLLASASFDDTIRIWGVGTRKVTRIIQLDEVFHRLSFSSDAMHLVTDRGLLELTDLPKTIGGSRPHSCLYVNSHGWVSRKSENFLRLHPDYGVDRIAVRDNVLAVMHASGRKVLIKIDPF
jgi:WD40 repeat protein